ncbi:MAG: PstS family phosphate ABC transporter substrate-binding protein [Oscillatoriophycideae cyanobacterium NC_groundwater_1537_Pr4_S-0.65um_50_18]|nr:PstS family phosphate ABC transporter substrate-binding protein [Oscillatoriophycideae cyanobacterium NC_groundwater_1537_Pr4_S-0.65um_50_18]
MTVSMQVRLGLPFSLMTTVLVVLASCSTPAPTLNPLASTAATDSEASGTATTIKVDGSSTVYPISTAVATEFQQANPNTAIAVEFSGTTGGFRKFCAGETDISNASRPISTEEIAACRQAGVRYLELPIAFDALTIVVNPQNDWVKELTVEELKKIWEPAAQGKVKTWQQVRASFPNRPLTLYGAGTDSGTYDYFAEVITEGAETRTDYTGSEDDNVLVEGVESDPAALGFFGLAYYEQNRNRLKAVPIDDGRGKGAVLPSPQTVESATYQPLSRPLFIYVNVQASQQKTALRDFVQFYMKNAKRIAAEVGYVPLPQEAYDIGEVHLYKGEVGTAYEGKPQPYLTIREVLQKEQTF